MDINTIRILISQKRYQVKHHAIHHALQEGFNETHIVDCISSGKIIEHYSDRNRVLIAGKIILEDESHTFLHVIVEQNYPNQIEIVTAYIPNESEWRTPYKRRRKR